MRVFLVDLENKPGILASVAEAIAAKDVNITSVSGTACGRAGRVAILTNDDAMTRVALAETRCTWDEMEVIETTLADQPGRFAEAARRLADVGINIEAVIPIGMAGHDVRMGFVTSDPVEAREALAAVALVSR
jgi:hypothetical protein